MNAYSVKKRIFFAEFPITVGSLVKNESKRSSESWRCPGFLRVISYPALDAPLVAASWWIIFARAFGNSDWTVVRALFPAVWSIYLLDRIHDAKDHHGGPPLRKQFAVDRLRLLKVLAVTSAVWAIVESLSLSQKVWIQVGVLAGFTAGYFLLFRWKRQVVRFPCKETMIGVCFAAGVGVPFASPIHPVKIGGLLVFGALCVVNCLLVSRAEAWYDRTTDPSAYFAGNNSSFPFRGILAAACVMAGILCLSGLHPVATMSLFASSLLLFGVTLQPDNGLHIQELADAALWLPGIAGAVLVM